MGATKTDNSGYTTSKSQHAHDQRFNQTTTKNEEPIEVQHETIDDIKHSMQSLADQVEESGPETVKEIISIQN